MLKIYHEIFVPLRVTLTRAAGHWNIIRNCLADALARVNTELVTSVLLPDKGIVVSLDILR